MRLNLRQAVGSKAIAKFLKNRPYGVLTLSLRTTTWAHFFEITTYNMDIYNRLKVFLQ